MGGDNHIDNSEGNFTQSQAVRVLVVEDEKHIATGLKLNFELEGYEVDLAKDAREAAGYLLHVEAYGAIILDVMLPDFDGIELCRRIRQAGNYTPVIMLTARSDYDDRVAGLEAGADDYIVKPFDLQELLARLRSALRRSRWNRDEVRESTAEVFSIGRAKVDVSRHKAFVDGQALELTRLEVDLIKYFVSNPDRTLSREELLEMVWNLKGYRNTRTVDNFLGRLRRYFEDDPSNPVHLVSVRGVGYQFVSKPND